MMAALTGPWTPLLKGSLRRDALETIHDIAVSLSGLPKAPHQLRSDQAEDEYGLLTGRAGVALFFGYLARAGLYDGAEQLARRFLNEAEAALMRHNFGSSMCSGFTGIAWAHSNLRRHFFGEPDGGELGAIDEVLLTWLRDSRSTAEFDVLYGLVGIGVYALERLPRRRARTMLRLVVERLAGCATRLGGLPGWRSPPSRNSFRKAGEFNLGLAHGTPGVVAFLARVVEAGVALRSAAPLLWRATEWLLARRHPEAGGSIFPSYCELDGTPGPSSRAAWCYGDPGVSTALWAAGISLDDRGLQDEALRIACHARRRAAASTRVHDTTLCHGAAGLAHIYHRWARSTGDARMRTAAVKWFERALSFRRPGQGVGGFVAEATAGPRRTSTTANAGLLTGATGVGLALLAAVTPIEPAWDRILLLDI